MANAFPTRHGKLIRQIVSILGLYLRLRLRLSTFFSIACCPITAAADPMAAVFKTPTEGQTKRNMDPLVDEPDTP
ncbi:MAG: hypothetical protein ABGY24_09345, partial [bacterium]